MEKETYEKIIEILIARLNFVEWQYELEKEENAQLKKQLKELENKHE
jgi:hypothetical protein